MRRLVSALAIALLLGPGCGSPARLDTSSDAALAQSKKAILSAMPESERMSFNIDCLAAIGDEHITKTGERSEKGEKLTDKDLFRPLEGMTAAEIKAKAESMRAAGK
jgi:hypothetical protein